MKYLILLLLTMTACCEKKTESPEYKFVYNQKVRVIGGFYKGCTGEVKGTHSYSDCADAYAVYLNGGPMYQTICGDKLEAIEEDKK